MSLKLAILHWFPFTYVAAQKLIKWTFKWNITNFGVFSIIFLRNGILTNEFLRNDHYFHVSYFSLFVIRLFNLFYIFCPFLFLLLFHFKHHTTRRGWQQLRKEYNFYFINYYNVRTQFFSLSLAVFSSK